MLRLELPAIVRAADTPGCNGARPSSKPAASASRAVDRSRRAASRRTTRSSCDASRHGRPRSRGTSSPRVLRHFQSASVRDDTRRQRAALAAGRDVLLDEAHCLVACLAFLLAPRPLLRGVFADTRRARWRRSSVAATTRRLLPAAAAGGASDVSFFLLAPMPLRQPAAAARASSSRTVCAASSRSSAATSAGQLRAALLVARSRAAAAGPAAWAPGPPGRPARRDSAACRTSPR